MATLCVTIIILGFINQRFESIERDGVARIHNDNMDTSSISSVIDRLKDFVIRNTKLQFG